LNQKQTWKNQDIEKLSENLIYIITHLKNHLTDRKFELKQ